MPLHQFTDDERARAHHRRENRLKFLEGLENSPFEVANMIAMLAHVYNLGSDQALFLLHRGRFVSDRDCREFLNLPLKRLQHWKMSPRMAEGKLQDFQGAYDEFMRRQPELAANMMRSLYMRAAERTRDMLEATKLDRNGRPVPDFQAQGKAIEIVMRHEGRFDNDTTFDVVMDAFQKLVESKRKQLPEGRVVAITTEEIKENVRS